MSTTKPAGVASDGEASVFGALSANGGDQFAFYDGLGALLPAGPGGNPPAGGAGGGTGGGPGGRPSQAPRSSFQCASRNGRPVSSRMVSRAARAMVVSPPTSPGWAKPPTVIATPLQPSGTATICGCAAVIGTNVTR